MGNSVPSVKADDGAVVDPQYGFSGQRKERTMVATAAEMEAAKIPLKDRDYCAHYLLKFMGCRADNFPLVYKCEHEKHEYAHCQYEDYVLRMKEYERNRRLEERSKRKATKAAREHLSE